MLTTAEVIETSIAYENNPEDRNGNPIPLGSVRIRFAGRNGPADEAFAFPATNTSYVPLVGEHVICFKADSANTNPGFIASKWFYISPYQIQGGPHMNPLPGSRNPEISGGSGQSSVYASVAAAAVAGLNPYKPGEDFTELSTVKSLQPYEGDIIIQGRVGAGLRLGRSYSRYSSQYAVKPFWSGNGPITILSNGLKKQPGPNKYVIEDPNTTDSIMLMTSSQKIKMKLGQTNLGTSVQEPGAYTKPSVIISSDRILFNAKEERVIIVSKKDIINSTPKWAMEMDKFFNLMEDLVSELVDLTSAKATYTTGVGPTGPATNAAKVKKIFDELKKMKQ